MKEKFTQFEKLTSKDDNFDVEYEVLPVETVYNENIVQYSQRIAELDAQLEEKNDELERLNDEVDRLTNHADAVDYTVAVASGVITGLIDAYVIGEIDLKKCHEWGNDKIQAFVKKVAGEKGDDPGALDRAIRKLEELTKEGFPSDSNTDVFGGGRQHHLRDFAHHPTLVGLFFSIATQFTGMCYGTATDGRFIVVPVEDKTRIGKTFPEKIAYGTITWFFHLVSDMAGSSANAGAGTGIPGPILSLAKELSVLPPFSTMTIGEIPLSQFLSKIFNGTLFADHDAEGKIIKDSVVNVDFRTELGIVRTQVVPVLINEVIVRVFYSIHQLTKELKREPVSQFEDLKTLNWKRILPFRNRTVARMLTIASGSFMAVDMTDAVAHAVKKVTASASAGLGAAVVSFASTFLLRVNFVNGFRFVMAFGTEIKMEKQKGRSEAQRMRIYNEFLRLTNVKLYYTTAITYEKTADMMSKDADIWIEAKDTQIAIAEMYKTMAYVLYGYKNAMKSIMTNIARTSGYFDGIEKHNPGLMDDLFGEELIGRENDEQQ